MYLLNSERPLFRFFLNLVLLNTALSTICLACECIGVKRPCEHLRSDAAFVGRVIETISTKHPVDKNSWTLGYSMRFVVETPLLGILGREMVIETGNGGGDCGTPLAPGGQFLIFAYKDKDGKFWTGMCSGNQKLDGTSDSEQTVRQYQELVKKGSTSIFGQIFHARPMWQGDDLRDDVPPRPYQGMVVRAESRSFTSSTRTMSDGSY